MNVSNRIFQKSSPIGYLRILLPSLLALGITTALAEEARRPVSAKIIPGKEQAKGAYGSESGDVQVTFSDKSKAMLTGKSHCKFPLVSRDGSLVGWSYGEIMEVQSSSLGGQFVGNNKLRVMRGNKIAADFTVDTLIRKWEFSPDLKFVYIVDMGLHGPTTISKGKIASGKIVDSHNSMNKDLPAWARPYADHIEEVKD